MHVHARMHALARDGSHCRMTHFTLYSHSPHTLTLTKTPEGVGRHVDLRDAAERPETLRDHRHEVAEGDAVRSAAGTEGTVVRPRASISTAVKTEVAAGLEAHQRPHHRTRRLAVVCVRDPARMVRRKRRCRPTVITGAKPVREGESALDVPCPPTFGEL